MECRLLLIVDNGILGTVIICFGLFLCEGTGVNRPHVCIWLMAVVWHFVFQTGDFSKIKVLVDLI